MGSNLSTILNIDHIFECIILCLSNNYIRKNWILITWVKLARTLKCWVEYTVQCYYGKDVLGRKHTKRLWHGTSTNAIWDNSINTHSRRISYFKYILLPTASNSWEDRWRVNLRLFCSTFGMYCQCNDWLRDGGLKLTAVCMKVSKQKDERRCGVF